MQRFLHFFIFCLILINLKVVYALQSNWNDGLEAKVQIISPYTHNNNDSLIYLGLRYKFQEGWKTFWRSPGETGFPQELDWSKSKNVSDVEILWPVPSEFEILGTKSIGYQKETVFPLKVKLKNINQETFFLFDINFLICNDICIPGNAHLELILPPGQGNITDHYFAIERSLSLVPKKNLNISRLENVSVKAISNNNDVSIVIDATSQDIFINPRFYLYTEFGLPFILPDIDYSTDYKNVIAKFNFDKKLIFKDKFNLGLILKDNHKAYDFANDIDIEITKNAIIQNQSIIYFFLIAFIGGLILNIMPCVLPVLSIKLLSILRNSENSLSIRKSFILTSIGIIASFNLMAIVFIGLRLVGVNIGWGMQFQQPLFLMVIALILSLFTLNLFGFFEFQTPSIIHGKNLINKNYFKDFFNGFFVTILATPCSAPFVGTALTVAFTQSILTMFGIFCCMGIGLAFPYLLISSFPSMTNTLPKPGAWMIFVRYFLGLLLFGTLIWIGSILLNHFNLSFIIVVSLLFLLTSLGLKFYKKKLLVVITTSVIFFGLPYFAVFNSDQIIKESDWIDLTTVEINDYIQNNDIIFIDITADWCATCQFNKINVINSSIIQKTFKKNNIIKLRGDWTKPNKKIENFLHKHSKFGIPLNVMYNNSYPEGIVLSELLTTKEILEIINKMQGNL